MSELTPDRDQPKVAAWRTVFLTAFGLAVVAGCFAWASRKGTMDMFVAQAFGSLCVAYTVAVSAVAVKALGEHLGTGSGVKNAWAALVSDVKPGDSAPAPQTPRTS